MLRVLIFVVVLIMPTFAVAEIPDKASPETELYRSYCATCHVLPDPARLDWQAWRSILYVMEKRMDERDIEKPNRDEWQTIARYLKSHAR